MNTRTRTALTRTTLACLALGTASTQAAFVTTGLYDENAIETNAVDRSALFAGGTGGASAANTISVADFTTLVGSAFAVGAGGVIDFETGAFAGTQGPVEGTFAGGTKTITLSGPDDFVFNNSTGTGRLPISGTNMVTQFNSPGDGFRFSSIALTGAGLAPTERITHLGFSLLDKTGGSNLTVTALATFSDGSTVTLSSDDYLGVGTGEDNNDDIFFGFVAPAGESIISVTTSGPGTFVNLDDVAIVTNAIPEPSSLLLFGLGGLCMMARRRNA